MVVRACYCLNNKLQAIRKKHMISFSTTEYKALINSCGKIYSAQWQQNKTDEQQLNLQWHHLTPE